MATPGGILAPPALAPELLDALVRSGIAETAGGWASLPEVALLIAQHTGRGPRTGLANVPPSFRTLAGLATSRTGPDLTRVGPVLFVSTSVQTHRVLASVRDALQPKHGPPSGVRLPRLSPAGLARARTASRELHSRYRDVLVAAKQLEPPDLGVVLLKIEGLTRRADTDVLASEGIRSVVVATQHNGATRAVLAAAHRPGSGATSFYVPHAPVAANIYYEDLPVHRALLRGPAEASFYAALGADLARLPVVGDPSRPPGPDDLPTSDEIVYAPSPHPEAVLRADIDVLRCIDRPLTVSLHPRMSVERYAPLFPPTWSVLQPGSTIAHLQAHGALAVAQHGSGVGLDALALGIDVIDLCHEGGTPNYPYLEEPHVQFAHDAPSLRTAIARLDGRRGTASARVAHARAWSGDAGVNAVRSITEELERDGTADHPPVLLDRWRRPATLR